MLIKLFSSSVCCFGHSDTALVVVCIVLHHTVEDLLVDYIDLSHVDKPLDVVGVMLCEINKYLPIG